MINFKEFLAEAAKPGDKQLTLDQAVKVLKTRGKQSLKTRGYPVLWRGVRSWVKPRISLRDSTKFSRESANTSNHYTILIDNLPSFKGWPKRSKSIITHGDSDRARGYGQLYAVFPLDNAKIASTGAYDIWDVEFDLPKTHVSNLKTLTSFLNGNMVSDKSLERLSRDVRNLDLPRWDLWGPTIWRAIEDNFTPQKLGFRKLKVNELVSAADEEVWIEGPSLLVHDDLLPALQGALRK